MTGNAMSARVWCTRCGVLYVSSTILTYEGVWLPQCECAGDPPAEAFRASPHWAFYLMRVHLFQHVEPPGGIAPLRDSSRSGGMIMQMDDPYGKDFKR